MYYYSTTRLLIKNQLLAWLISRQQSVVLLHWTPHRSHMWNSTVGNGDSFLSSLLLVHSYRSICHSAANNSMNLSSFSAFDWSWSRSLWDQTWLSCRLKADVTYCDFCSYHCSDVKSFCGKQNKTFSRTLSDPSLTKHQRKLWSKYSTIFTAL